jgi:glycosyltransferase involved in cell wall biosynthesis
MRVVIVRAALETVSPRGPKTAQVLSSHGHNVILLGWDRECKYPKVSREEHYEARRIRFRAPFGPKVLAFLPIWWMFEFLWLVRHKWDVVQAMDFDTIMPAVVAAKIKRKKVIYEIADIYYKLVKLPGWFASICIFVDKLFIRCADGMVLASEGAVKELHGIPNKNVVVILNSPPDLCGEPQVAAKDKDIFTIFYAGALFRSRKSNLDKVFQAIKSMNKVRMVVAGYGDEVDQITAWAGEAKDKVQFLGKISYSQVLAKTAEANLLVALYDPSVYVHRWAYPTKLFEAMMCGKPILVSKGSAMAELVDRENCGLAVDCQSGEEIKQAIAKLKQNPELCNLLGANGRKVYEREYRWDVMEKRLLSLYSAIVSKC